MSKDVRAWNDLSIRLHNIKKNKYFDNPNLLYVQLYWLECYLRTY